MELRVIEPQALPLRRAIRQSAGLLAASAEQDASYLGVIVVPAGASVVLGRLQHAGRVLSSIEGIPVLRRATSGPAVSIDGGLLVSLAVPAKDALFRDATTRTTLNRNVRPFLWGLAAAGANASYFGREWIAWKHRPFALLGLDVGETGAVLIEAWITAQGTLELPRSLVTDIEASTDRLRARVPTSLHEILGDCDLHEIGRLILEGAAERLGADAVPWIAPEPEHDLDVEVRDLHSPLPPGATPRPPVAAPIGWIDSAVGPLCTWIGGDMLGPAHALGAEIGHTLARSTHPALPLEGCVWDDLLRAHHALSHAR